MSNLEKIIEEKLNYNISYDVVKRTLNNKMTLYFLSSMADMSFVNEVIKGFMIKENQILNSAIFIEDNVDKVIEYINSGCLLIQFNNLLYIVETRSYPNRSISESESEKSLKGSHDSFTESILTNTALIRRRIKDDSFKCELFTIGKSSKTDVTINYIDSKVNKKLLKHLKKQLNNINVDYLNMSERGLSQLLFKQNFQIFPKVRYSERPDIASIQILKGYIVILVDTSSSSIIIPTTFFELNEQIEEYQLPSSIATINRFFRIFCVFLGVFLLPIWYILCIDKTSLNSFILLIDDIDRTTLFFQIITVSIFLNCIRIASFYSGTLLSTSLSLIASIILSGLAVETGLVHPEVVFYCCLSLIASYCISNYETGRAISFWNIILLISVGLFYKIGFIIASTLLFLSIVTINNYNIYYLDPFIPFDIKKLLKILVKLPEKNK